MQQTKPDGDVTATELEEKKLLAQGLDDAGNPIQMDLLLREKLCKVILKPTLAAVVDERQLHLALEERRFNIDSDFSLPVVCERACDVAAAPTQWLWPGRIPSGRFTVLAAEQRHVASRIACDLAARVSARSGWPDGKPSDEQARLSVDRTVTNGANSPGGSASSVPPADAAEQIRNQAQVLFLTSRGELDRSVVPGLMRAGADLARVLCVSGILSRPGEDEAHCVRNVALADNFGSLCGAIEALPALRLIVIDPIEEFLQSGSAGHGASPATAAIDALEEMARDHNVAILGIAGLCRGSARPGALPPLKHRILASRVLVAWGIVRERGEPGRYVLAPLCNVIEGTGTWLPLQLDGDALTWDAEPIPEPADEVRPAARRPERERQWLTLEEATALLQRYLAGGCRLASEVQQMADALGISRAMLDRVKEDLGIKSEKLGLRGKWQWALPNHSNAGGDTARFFGEERGPLGDSRGFPKEPRLENSPQV